MAFGIPNARGVLYTGIMRARGAGVL